MVDPHRAIDTGRAGTGPLLGQSVEPVEGLADFGRAEAGFDQARLQRVAVVQAVGVVADVVFEQVQQDVQDAFFHCPRPAPVGAPWDGGPPASSDVTRSPCRATVLPPVELRA